MSEQEEKEASPPVVVRRDAEVTVTPGVITVAPLGQPSGTDGQTPDEGSEPETPPDEEVGRSNG